MRLWAGVVLLAACGGEKGGEEAPTDTGSAGVVTTTESTTPAGQGTVTPPRDWCPSLSVTATLTLGPGDDLQGALDAAVPGDVIALEAGLYELDIDPLVIATDGITLIGATGQASDVTVDGTYGPSDLLWIQASDVTVAHITFRRSFFRGVRITPPAGGLSGVELYGIVVEDTGAEAVLVEPDGAGSSFVDGGVVSCSTLRLTDEGRDRLRVACDAGGVAVRGGRDWSVRDNTIEGFWCPELQARPAVFAGDGARGTVVERNRLNDVAVGVQLGEGSGGGRRGWDDSPCPEGAAQHYEGLVRNNMVAIVEGGLLESSSGFLSGVRLQSACESTVLHNTVYSDIAPAGAAIEFSHPTTTGVVANNLTTHGLARRDDALIVSDTNYENAEAILFLYPRDRDVHLNPGAADAVDDGSDAYLDLCPEDVDGQRRDARPDMGADELLFP